MCDKSTLVRKRGGLKASLSHFTKFVEGYKQAQEPLNDIQVTNLRERIVRIEHVYSQFVDVQNEIEMIVDSEALEEQYSERAIFEDSYFDGVATARNLIPRDLHSDQQSSRSHSSVQASNASANKNEKRLEKIPVKLPDIPLPTFDGSFECWLGFRDIFQSLINNNEELTGIQKFHYLRASLKEKALEVIKSIEFSEQGYDVAWNALVNRFNNQKLLVHTHLKAIFSIENIHKESSVKIQGSKLDQKTVIDWERFSCNNKTPFLTDLTSFLRNRADILETIEFKSNLSSSQGKNDKYNKKYNTSRSLTVGKLSCYFCNEEHSIYSCESFASLSLNDKRKFVKDKRLCNNCLRNNHFGKRCHIGPCKKCRGWHNSLLHPESDNSTVATSKGMLTTPGPSGYVFLSTARIKVKDKNGKIYHARALLDCGSQSSFISLDLFKRLGLNESKASLSVSGIANIVSQIKSKCQVQIHSTYSEFSVTLTCFILPEITSISSASNINLKQLKIPANYKLADPEFPEPGPIDILIGADAFWGLLETNRISCGKHLPYLQDTKFGWILVGMIGNNKVNSSASTCNLSANIDLHKTLSKFWEIEEVNTGKHFSKNELRCEQIFSETTRRDPQGRFIVTLPLKQKGESLGNSRELAEKRFYALERRLSKNNVLREYYVNFMREYEELKHMTLDRENYHTSTSSVEYYMPHHGVLRESSSTTKLRVVFDASAPSSNGVSLNNIQLIGPVLQDDLFSILLRFRKHKFVISADVVKMYRQILVEPCQRNLQKILWRYKPTDELESYTLNTVTYGQACASYLAIRCLIELANECEEFNPVVAEIIRHDFYVDDLLTGADSIEQARIICHEIKEILMSGQYELRKWCSNEPEILKSIQNAGATSEILEFAPEEKAKTLGLNWSCKNDVLVYNLTDVLHKGKYTKRGVLSLVSKIFDPLGLLSPCIVLAKVFMQHLWSEKLDWDDQLPDAMTQEWHKFCSDLVNLNNFEIPRHVICGNVANIELHGFADSSEKAYGACIYLRSMDQEGKIAVNLLCAKTKVAPIKSLTIPKLELCAALLLARLSNKVLQSIKLQFKRCTFWSDSTITLAWLNSEPNVLKIFVANRVAEIQNLTENHEWRYVPSQDNPADLASRGLLPSKILGTSEWWQGPSWLKMDSSYWPRIQCHVESIPELKPQRISAFPASIEISFPFDRFSSFSRLQRTTAYMLRFKHNCNNRLERNVGPLSVSEIRQALKILIKIAQNQSFSDEIEILLKGKSIPLSSKISSLNPFLDNEGILRVGGRLKHSDLPIEKKHPIVLHSNHYLTKLIFKYQHICLLHPGPQLLLATIRNEYWPIAGRNLARSITRKCLECFRYKSVGVSPIMGNLPRERIVPASPFYVTGVDYAGPFLIRKNRRTVEKGYIGVFVCFTTKALHLELISSLSSKSFIQALRRFVARRGKPSKIYSDNGTTFIGANRELGMFLRQNRETLSVSSSNDNIEWSFIPPYSPHFGGLWEAGVKSVKHHLKRVLASTKLSFEEFTTLLYQIEAILNSRPISPLSSDPQDLLPLTPGHFLIGRPLVAVPDKNVEETNVGRLTRFQLVQQITQHFWRRWHLDYINELQQRHRWKTNKGHLTPGSLVLLKEDNNPPTDWKMGRILKLHPGSDQVSRVASIQTSQGVVKRSFSKICPLPIEV